MSTSTLKLSKKEKLESEHRRKCLFAILKVIRNNCDDYMPPTRDYFKGYVDEDTIGSKAVSAENGFKHGESRLCYEVIKEMIMSLLRVHRERTPTAKKQTFIAIGFFLLDNNTYFDVLGLEETWVRAQINKMLNAIGLPGLKPLLEEYKQCQIKI